MDDVTIFVRWKISEIFSTWFFFGGGRLKKTASIFDLWTIAANLSEIKFECNW
jgi:hypothetical protein